MKSFYARGLFVALGLALSSSFVSAQEFGTPSLLPIPSATANYPVTRVAANENFYQPEGVATPEASVVSPSDQQPMQAPMVSPDYHQAMQQEWGDSGIGCTDGVGGCESGMCGPGGCCKNFVYAYGGALWMTREYSSGFVASLNDTTFSPELCTCDSPLQWSGGFETRLGYGFNCGHNALEVTYWGLYPGDNNSFAYDPAGGAGLMSNIDFSSLDYDNGTTDQNVMDWYAGAAAHRLYTENEIHNVEVNFLGQSYGGGMFGCGVCGTGLNGSAGCNSCGPRFGSNWLMGLRIFTFNDKLSFATDADDTLFDHDDTELTYYNNVNNTLVGFQLGGGISYRLFDCFTIYGNGKGGVYGNHIYAEQCVEGSNGYATINNGVNSGLDYTVKGSKDTVAFIAQLDAGARWQFSQHFAFNFGYRVMGVSGVGITSQQIPADFQNLEAAGYINSDSSLLLHGGYAGFEFCF